ncbi:MAG: tRNA (adenosine(37)-N6)-threonylcarbamoyltransferase complex transferase subunit TsaD, partial [Gemmatimonadaceae bacterium]
LEELAATVSSSRYRFPRPMVRSSSVPGDADYYDLSFSGLKTAVLTAVRGIEADGDDVVPQRAALARAFQDSMIDTLVEKTERAARAFKRKRIVIGGGVSCNTALQKVMQAKFAARGAVVYAPSPRLATDNAAMIAAAGIFRMAAGDRASLSLTAQATMPIPGLL